MTSITPRRVSPCFRACDVLLQQISDRQVAGSFALPRSAAETGGAVAADVRAGTSAGVPATEHRHLERAYPDPFGGFVMLDLCPVPPPYRYSRLRAMNP